MSEEKLRELIDNILKEKKKLLISKINSVKEDIVNQLEDLKELEDFLDYQIPDDLQLNNKNSEDDKVAVLNKCIKEISTADNQLNLVNHLIEGINSFSSRAAIFLLRDDKLIGWNGKGFSDRDKEIKDEDVKKIFFSLSANTIFKYAIDKKEIYSGPPLSQPDDHLIYSRFGGGNPEKIFVKPFLVKGKPQAVIYADSFGEEDLQEKEVEILSIVGEMSLDLLPFKQKILARVQTKEFLGEEPEPEEEEEKELSDSQEFHSMEETVHSTKENDPERKARVIINDIILYNRNIVEEGRNKKNLYRLLEDTILQAKEEYMRKFNDLSSFESNLIKILAKGDREALEGYKFETFQ